MRRGRSYEVALRKACWTKEGTRSSRGTLCRSCVDQSQRRPCYFAVAAWTAWRLTAEVSRGERLRARVIRAFTVGRGEGVTQTLRSRRVSTGFDGGRR